MLAQSVADILSHHVTLAVEGIDRMYLNVFVPGLQYEQGVVQFFRAHRGQPLPSAALMNPMTRSFVAKLESFVAQRAIPLVAFRKGERKDAVMAERLRRFAQDEGVVFVGKAQEKTSVLRTEKRRSPTTGRPYPWIVKSTAMVNHYYIYAVDRDFGPFFLKFCSYFPFNAKLCLNGHEYAKRQLAREGIAFEALDNGVLSCADPKRLQKICDGLGAEKIDGFLRKWLRLLPHPFTGADRKAGYRYDISILQAEFSLTQVLDRPVHGRLFFEQVIRENLDLGRPEEVHADLQSQDHPQDTGTVPHPHPDPRRHPVPERLLQERAHQAVSQGEPGVAHRDHHQQRLRLRHRQAPAQPAQAARDRLCGQSPAARRGALKPRLHAHGRHLPDHQQPGRRRWSTRLRPALCRSARPCAMACHHPVPTAHAGLPLGRSASPSCRPVRPRSKSTSQGALTYQLRRLRLHGMIERLPNSFRYRVTEFGWRAALFFTRLYNRLLRPGLAAVLPGLRATDTPLKRAFDNINAQVNACINQAQLAA